MLDLIRRGLQKLERENHELWQTLAGQKHEFEAKLAEIKASYQDQYKQKVRELKRENEHLRRENDALRNEFGKLGHETALGLQDVETFEDSQKKRPLQDTAQCEKRIKTEPKLKNEKIEQKSNMNSSPVKQNDSKKSPTKVLMYRGKPLNVQEYTDSEFNMLPTQYSLQVSANSPDRPCYVKLSSSPIKEVVEDSQDPGILQVAKHDASSQRPLRDTTAQTINIPHNSTKLQRRDFLRKYFQSQLEDPSFHIDLSTNPITENSWCLTDFKPNPNFGMKPPGRKAGVSSMEQNKINDFYKKAGGPVQEMPESQLYDKFPSPPGFMTSEFPLTQEAAERRQVIIDRQNDRLRRRLTLSIHGEEFIFYEEILNRFVEAGRYICDVDGIGK